MAARIFVRAAKVQHCENEKSRIMTTKWTKAMQGSLNQIMKSAHVIKESLMAKGSGNKKSCETGSHAGNKHA